MDWILKWILMKQLNVKKTRLWLLKIIYLIVWKEMLRKCRKLKLKGGIEIRFRLSKNCWNDRSSKFLMQMEFSNSSLVMVISKQEGISIWCIRQVSIKIQLMYKTILCIVSNKIPINFKIQDNNLKKLNIN